MASREKRASFKVGDKGDVRTLRRDITIGWADIFFFFEETVKYSNIFVNRKREESGRKELFVTISEESCGRLLVQANWRGWSSGMEHGPEVSKAHSGV